MSNVERRISELEAQIGQLTGQAGGRFGVLRELTSGHKTYLHYHDFGPGVPPEPAGSKPIPRLVTVGVGMMYETITAAQTAIGAAATASTPYILWIMTSTTEPASLYLRPYIALVGAPNVTINLGSGTFFIARAGNYDIANLYFTNTNASYPPLYVANVYGIPNVVMYHVRTLNSSGPGQSVSSTGTVLVARDCNFKGGSYGLYASGGAPSPTLYDCTCEATSGSGIGMRLRYVTPGDAAVCVSIGSRFVGNKPVQIDTSCTWQHYGSQFNRATSTITGTETLLPGSVPAHDHSGPTVGDEVPLASLGSYADGKLIIGGATDWETLPPGSPFYFLCMHPTTGRPYWKKFDWDDFNASAYGDVEHSHLNIYEGGQLDHGNAMVSASLLDDDHTQYLLATGVRALNGDLRGTGAGFPGLGTTTLAEKLGHVYLGTQKDVYPWDDEYPLFQRGVNQVTTPEQHFNTAITPLSSWAGAPFITPIANMDSPSMCYIYPPVTNNRAFLYEVVNIGAGSTLSVQARLFAGAYIDIAGVRADDGSDNNYHEFGIRTNGVVNGMCELISRVRVGGGAVTTTVWATVPAPVFYEVHMYGAGNIYIQYNVNGYGWKFLGSPAARAYTATRLGLVTTQGLGGSGDRAAYFDWYNSP